MSYVLNYLNLKWLTVLHSHHDINSGFIIKRVLQEKPTFASIRFFPAMNISWLFSKLLTVGEFHFMVLCPMSSNQNSHCPTIFAWFSKDFLIFTGIFPGIWRNVFVVMAPGTGQSAPSPSAASPAKSGSTEVASSRAWPAPCCTSGWYFWWLIWWFIVVNSD